MLSSTRWSHALLTALTLLLVGCGSEDCPAVGALDDARFPQLCLTDKLRVWPDHGYLTPDEPGSMAGGVIDAGVAAPSDATLDAGGSAVSAPAVLEMFVSGTDEDGHPREAVHVDISLLNTNGLAKLIPRGKCSSRTPAELHCQLDVDGLVRFGLEHANKGAGTVIVRAQSGEVDDDAIVEVVDPTVDLALTAAPRTLSAFQSLTSPVPLVCTSSSVPLPLACWDAPRRVKIVAGLRKTDGDPETEDPPVSSHSFVRAVITLSAPADMPDTGDAGSDSEALSVGEGFLSRSESCDPSQASGASLDIRLEPRESEFPAVYLCVSRAGGAFTVTATLEAGTTLEKSVPVTADASPYAVILDEPAAAAGGTDTADAIVDCLGRPLTSSSLTFQPETLTPATTRVAVTDAQGLRGECEFAMPGAM